MKHPDFLIRSCQTLLKVPFALAILLASVTGSSGQSVPTVPEFTGERIYLVGSPQGIDAQSIKREIGRIEQASRQSYFVVAVRNAGPGADSTRKFMDRIAEAWPDQARKRGLRFDVKRVVVIVLGVENRKIVILGGTELQQKFAFRDPYIDRELVRPYFTPIAQKGDLTQALRVLVEQTDRWITAKDKEQALRQSEIAARSLQLRKEADGAIAETRGELAETQALLKTRHEEGLATTDLDSRVAQVAASLETAASKLSENPAEALDIAREANRVLLETAEQVRRIPLLRTDLDVRLSKSMDTFAMIAAAIDEARKAGATTTRQEEALDQARMKLDEARGLIAKEPFKADSLVNEGEGRLNDILNEARALPKAVADLTKLKADGSQSIGATTTLLADARKRGVKLGDAAAAVRSFETGVVNLQKLPQDDPIALSKGYREVLAAAESINKLLPPMIARHRLFNRTLPMAALAGIGVVGAGLASLSWRARSKYRREVTSQFEEYRSRAVALMDRLDGLRKEHEMLMKVDPDFTEPSTGRTLALYREVETDLNGLWDKWLHLMDVWERADKLVRSANSLNSEQITKAKSLLESEGNFEGIEATVESCRKRLDDLGNAHDDVRKAHARASETVKQAEAKLADLTQRQIRVLAESNALKSVDGVLAEARGLIVADPVGAAEIVKRAESTLSELSNRADRLVKLADRAESLKKRSDEIAAETAKLRSGGLILREPEADPDPKLARAARMLEVAGNELRKADADLAERVLGDVETILAAAETELKRHQEARAACATAIPASQKALAELETVIRDNSAILERMRQSYAPASLSGIAENLETATDLVATAAAAIDRASADAEDSSQRYLAAIGKIDQANEAITRAGSAARAVGQRHEELSAIAAEIRQALPGLKLTEQETMALFGKSHEFVSDEARKSLDQAMKVVRRVEEIAAQPRPDWPEVQRVMQAASRTLDLARKQAEEDIAGYEKLKAREKQVQQRLDKVGSLLERGDKDRPPANQRYRQAREIYQRYLESAVDNSYGWDEKLRWLDEIADNADRAEQLANQDITLANGALAEIESATRTVRKSQAYYGSGVSADMSRAESLLSEARKHMAAQAYESAVEAAQAADHAASVALNKAEHAARKRRMQVDRTIVLGDPVVMGGLFDVLTRAGAEIARQSSQHGGGSWGGPGGGGGSGWSQSSSDSGGGSWGGGSSSSSWGGGDSGGSWSSGSSQSSW